MDKRTKIISWLFEVSASKWRYRIPNITIGLALLSSLATIGVLSTDIEGNYAQTLTFLVRLDMFFLLLLLLFLVYRITKLILSSRRGDTGSGLQRRLSTLFAILALTPAIVIATFSLIFFDLGLKTWFSERVSGALMDSRQVAKAYLQEHRKNIIGDALGLAREFDEKATYIATHADEVEKLLVVQGVLRNLTEALVFDLNGKIYGRYGLTGVLEMEPLNNEDILRAKEGGVVIFTNERSQRVRALVKLNNYSDTYAIIGRFVDPKVLGHIQNTETAIGQYETLESNRVNLQFSFTLVFAIVVMLLLVVAIWTGLSTALRLTRPITMLIQATNKVGRGQYKTKLEPDEGYDEIRQLMMSFNNMTDELRTSSRDLKTAYSNLSQRSNFIEALLSSLSTGVIALDDMGKVLFLNAQATKLLNIKEKDLSSKDLMTEVFEFKSILSMAIKKKKAQEQQITYGVGAMERKLFVRVSLEKENRDIKGYVVSFDDVGALENAQKNAAWSDVARRIAHEIKNPLTPIQLSAERLKRRYKKILDEKEGEVFDVCTDTIVRQVEEIGRLVDEFSSFARMPEAIITSGDVVQCVKQSYTLQRTAHNHIKYTLVAPKAIKWSFDQHQLGQVITNLMKNAFVAMNNAKISKQKIQVTIKKNKKNLVILIEDNGNGFPVEGRARLLEPYITFEKQGTGLGLSIVKKIVQDHNGTIALKDSELGGACVEIILKG